MNSLKFPISFDSDGTITKVQENSDEYFKVQEGGFAL